ncbi:MAG TPA: hypothetical protein VK927_07680 [Adhaeribacter sp.]|nr:hypothetical protein [Adhaeribacter sp.]
MKNLLLALLSLFAFYAQAQKDFRPGYIVTLQNDTLRGLVNYKGDIKSALKCDFKEKTGTEAQTFTPDQLLGYGFNSGRFFETQQIPIINYQYNKLTNNFDQVPVPGNQDLNFMEVLVKGRATLYFMTDAASTKHFYIRKEGSEIKELVYLEAFMDSNEQNRAKQEFGNRILYRSKRYAGTLTQEMSDCPALNAKIENTAFKRSAFIELVTDYNKCAAPDQKILLSKKPKQQLTWGVMAGVNFSKLNMTASHDHFIGKGSYGYEPTVTAGIFMDVNLPDLNEKLSLHNALLLSKKNHYSLYEVRNHSYSRYVYDAKFELTYIRLASILRYTLPQGRIKPFIGAGISNGLLTEMKEDIEETYFYMNSEPLVITKPAVFPTPRKYEFGMIGSLGLDFGLPGSRKLLLETRFEFANGFSPYTGIRARNTNISLLLGYGF